MTTVTLSRRAGSSTVYVIMKRRLKQACVGLLVAGAVAGLVWLVMKAGAEWSEAIVQALAAIGGLGYWAYRGRPRVTLRLLGSSLDLYLELTNVGNRIAKRVTITCDPPIPWDVTVRGAPKDKFGPIEEFGDMDRNQRYVVLFGHSGRPESIEALDKTTFEVSHDIAWGLRRRKSTMRFGGSGLHYSFSSESVGTPMGEVADILRNMDQPGRI